MPDRDEGKRRSPLDWVFPVIGLLMACAIAWGAGYLGARETERRYYTTRAYQDDAKTRAKRACVRLEPGATFECVSEYVKSAQEQANAEQELSAQQRAASAGLISAIVSFLALIATGTGLYYVRETLNATLTAVQDTGDATKAMQEANEIARESLVAQDRAWLMVEAEIIGTLEITGPEPEVRASICLQVTNVGGVPATNMSIAIEMIFNQKIRMDAVQRAIADKQKETPQPGWFPNSTIFPKRSFRQTHNIGCGSTPLAEIRSVFEEAGVGRTVLQLGIVGCVQYRLPGSLVLHQTGFAYEIQKIPTTTKGPALFENDLPIKGSTLRLVIPIDGSGLID